MTTVTGDIGVGGGAAPSTVTSLASYVHVRAAELVTTIAGVTIVEEPTKTLIAADGTWSVSVDPLPAGFAYEFWFTVGRFKSASRFVLVPSTGTHTFGSLADAVPIDHAGWGAPAWVAEILELLATGGAGGGLDAEAVRDTIGSALVAGSGISITVDDTGNTITITASGAGIDAEAVRDTMGTALVGGAGVAVTVDDAANTITITADVTQADLDAAIAALVASAPTLLNTLDELAAALGDDANFAATVTAALAARAPLDSPVFTGNPTAPTPATADSDGSVATTAHVHAAIAADAPEIVRDTMGSALVPGVGISLTVDDAANTITVTATGGTAEVAHVLYTGGAYPTQAGSPPAGLKLRHFYGPVQYTGATWPGVLDLYTYAELT